MNLIETKNIALQAVDNASKYLLTTFDQHSARFVNLKHSHDIKSNADLDSEKIILEILQK